MGGSESDLGTGLTLAEQGPHEAAVRGEDLTMAVEPCLRSSMKDSRDQTHLVEIFGDVLSRLRQVPYSWLLVQEETTLLTSDVSLSPRALTFGTPRATDLCSLRRRDKEI